MDRRISGLDYWRNGEKFERMKTFSLSLSGAIWFLGLLHRAQNLRYKHTWRAFYGPIRMCLLKYIDYGFN